MFSLEVRAPNTVEVGFRNVLSFVCNYIIREVGAIYSNKISRICSDRYTTEGILLNGLISIFHLFPFPWCPNVGVLAVALWAFPGKVRCCPLPQCVQPWLELQPRSSPCPAQAGGPGAAAALAAPGPCSVAPAHTDMEMGFVFGLMARNGAAVAV